jgi:ATP-binding cassette subfamily B protein
MADTTTTRVSFKSFMDLMRPRRALYLGGVLLVCAVLASERVFVAWVIKTFVDAIVDTRMGGLWRSLRMWLIFLALWVPAVVASTYLWRGTTLRLLAGLRERLYAHVQRLPLSYHEGRHSGDVLSVLTNDLTVASVAYEEHLQALLYAIITGASTGVAMFAMNWRLALVVLGAGLLPIVINAAYAGRLRRMGEEVQAQVGAVSERLSDLLAGYQVIRSYNLGAWILGRFGVANDALLKSTLRRVWLEAALGAASGGGILFMMLLPMGLGAYMVLRGEATFGDVIGITQLSGPVLYLVGALSGLIGRFQGSMAAIERITAVLDSPQEPERYPTLAAGEAAPAPESELLLQFAGVRFGYGEDEDVIRGLDLGVRPGARVAIVGPSGGGKSTVFKILLGCYPLRAGMVYVDGRPLTDWKLDQLRAQFAYIPQDAYLYAGSVGDNIRYGRPGASVAEVEAAARAANADRFIREMPQGYDTPVGERGARMSGGQRQRIAIARALLRNAPVLLLDEATSALDSESEALVQAALETLMAGRTTLAIAHRLSTVEHADQICVLAEGRMVEQGTQAELLAREGVFHHLYDLQFADQGPDDEGLAPAVVSS